MKLILSIAAGLALFTSIHATAVSNEIQFIEKFVFAKDRESVLKELIPGTEDYYFYHALHFQHTGQRQPYAQILEQWAERHPNSGQRTVLKNRQALLDYERDPQGALAYLKEALQVRFDHQRDRREDDPQLPNQLDPASITREAFANRALKKVDDLSGVDDTGLEALVRSGATLTAGQRRDLLKRVARPDFPLLTTLILDELSANESGGWGSVPIHGRLLKAQMDEILTKSKDLRNNDAFVRDYLRRLMPDDDKSLAQDIEEKRAHLERLWAFVQKLPVSFNSLKAHTLYHWLDFDRQQGRYDADRFVEYLQLPRPVAYINAEYLRATSQQEPRVNLEEDYRNVTTWPVIGNEEPLVEDYLLHFFIEANNTNQFSEYLADDWLKPLFAKAKILNGIGDQEKWYSLLDPAEYQRLLARVDIDFAPENAAQFGSDDDVKLAAHVKNVSNLIVKVYEINTLNYYLEHKSQIATDLNLDGLVANEEMTYDYSEAPLRRVRREFTFPNLKGKRGAWMIEFIGNGKSSRALIRKGALSSISRLTVDGELTFVLDENGAVVKDAAIWLGGHRFTGSEEDGGIVIPFSAQAGNRDVVLTDGQGFAALETLTMPSESYALQAGIYVNREQLTPGQDADVLIRPQLLLAGTPITLSALKELSLTLTATDLDGVETSTKISPFALREDQEAVHRFSVLDRMASLTVVLSGKVDVASRGNEETLSNSETFRINGIDASAQTADFQLGRAGDDWSVFMLGQNGEPLSQRAVLVEVRRRGFNDDYDVMMQTDVNGRIALGSLSDIARIKASADGYEAKRWYLPNYACHYQANLHASVGEAIRIPYAGAAKVVSAELLSLIESRNGQYVADHLNRVKLDTGFLTLTDLPAGDFELYLKEDDHAITIRVAEGTAVKGVVLGRYRQLIKRNETPLHIGSVEVAADNLVVQLANADAFSRVHVVATRYVPTFSIDDLLEITTAEPYEITLGHWPNLYTSGRKIGDEYRYVIDRRYATKFPGNMLVRPSVILNPWEQQATNTETEKAALGEEVDRLSRGAMAKRESLDQQLERQLAEGQVDFASLDFLPGDGVVLTNLKPDENGRVLIARAALRGRQHVQVLAADPENSVMRQVFLPEAELKWRNRAFASSIAPDEHFSEQKAVSILKAGESLVIRDLAAADLEVYDTLAKVHRYLATKSGNGTLTEFDFILRWPTLEAAKKRELYSKHACHELSFFLSRKDPEFFSQVVKPYLANKRETTFIDHYLLEHDLRPYLQAWRFGQLNIAERALLAKRLGGSAGEDIARHLSDLHALKPVDPEAEAWDFQTALGGLQLTAGGAAGAAGNLESFGVRSAGLSQVESEALGVMDAAASPFAAPAPASASEQGEKVPQLLAAVQLEGADSLAFESLGDKKALAEVGVDDESKSRFYFGRSRKQERGFYQKLDATKEWAENQYHQVPLVEQNADLITINGFWNDYATWSGEGAFLSTHFTQATKNFAEMMLVLALLELPFDAVDYEQSLENGQLTLVARSGMVVFRREVMPAPEAAAKGQLLVNQNFYRHGQRYVQRGSEKIDHFISHEFLKGVPYGCEVVITNPTSTLQKVEVLTQIPANAIPILNTQATKSVHLRLEPYTTQKLDYHFYFPQAGRMPHYPVHVSQDETTIAAAPAFEFVVVDKPTVVDEQSWEYASQWASNAEVIDYLTEHNMHTLDLERVAWRLKDVDFVRNLLELMGKRHVYHSAIYSYALHHGLAEPLRQHLQHLDGFVAQCGAWLDSPLLGIDPTERRAYQHLEYSPLVNPRAHILGGQQKILNEVFYQQYHRLLDILQYKPSLDSHDQLSVVYYLFLQDRIEEALAWLDRIDASQLNERLQYDYFQAYAAFYREGYSAARQIAQSYADYPVDRWQKVFANVVQQLDEIEGKAMVAPDPKDRDQRQDQLASTEPRFQFTVEDGKIHLTHENLPEIVLNYYEMDIEFLFSSNPFVAQDSARFSVIKPNLSERRQLKDGRDTVTIALPTAFEGKNVLIEMVGAGNKLSKAYYSNTLDVQLAENYGQVQVLHAKDRRPLSKVYVKVYAKKADGEVTFYKDGYTDLRGKFDYASLNTNTIDQVQNLSLLVMSTEHGAVIRDAKPPQQ